jgi:hypothetical protein
MSFFQQKRNSTSKLPRPQGKVFWTFFYYQLVHKLLITEYFFYNAGWAFKAIKKVACKQPKHGAASDTFFSMLEGRG